MEACRWSVLAGLRGTIPAALLAVGLVFASATDVAAEPETLSVRAEAPRVTAFDVRGTETPVVLRVILTAQDPIAAWEVSIANPIGMGVGVVELIRSIDRPGVVLADGPNDIVLGTNRSPCLKDAGAHAVGVSVTDSMGATVRATASVMVTGRARLSVKGVGRLESAPGTSLIWGTGSLEMRGRKVEVFCKTVSGRVRSLGTTRVSKANGYWKLRTPGLVAGIIKVKARTPYIAGTWDTLRITGKPTGARAPDFSKPKPVL
jgi:hypothetical protein